MEMATTKNVSVRLPVKLFDRFRGAVKSNKKYLKPSFSAFLTDAIEEKLDRLEKKSPVRK